MRKEDLENLMVAVTANNERYLVVDGWLIGEEYNMRIKDFNDDLTCGHEEDRIDKVYGRIAFLSDITAIIENELLWERKWIPDIGEKYYLADPTQSDFWNTGYWQDTDNGNYRLRLGLVYKTEEEAMEHGKRIVEMIKNERVHYIKL